MVSTYSLSIASNEIQQPDAVGTSPIERLPSELLTQILLHLINPSTVRKSGWGREYLPTSPNSTICSDARSKALPCLVASRTLSAVALPIVYRHLRFFEHSSFSDLEHNHGRAVRSLDLTQMSDLNASKIACTLSLTPLLRELHLNLSAVVKEFSPRSKYQLRSLVDNLQKLRYLEVLELTGLCDLDSQTSLTQHWSVPLLSHFSRLRWLDLSNTNIVSETLENIPTNARLEYLDISHCPFLPGSRLASFLTTHSSVKDSLTYLNANQDSESESALSQDDITRIITGSSRSLRSLNLGNSCMTSKHIIELQTLLELEDLSIGHGLRLDGLEEMILGPSFDFDDEFFSALTQDNDRHHSKYDIVLGPMSDAVQLCKLRRRLTSITGKAQVPELSTLRYLDLRSLNQIETSKIGGSVLLSTTATNLEIIELGEYFAEKDGLGKLCSAVGWHVREAGRRMWLERK